MGGEFSESQARKFETAHKGAGTARHFAAISDPDGGGVARHLVKIFAGLHSLFVRKVRIAGFFFQRLSFIPLELNEALSAVVFFNGRLFGHVNFVPWLLFAGRPFLALLAVRIFFIDNIETTLSADEDVPFRLVGFNGSFYFHFEYPSMLMMGRVYLTLHFFSRGFLFLAILCGLR